MGEEWHVIGESSSPEETREIGRRLAADLQPGDVVLLTGDLGAGKTQLVQGAAAGLGATEVPVSPTFNIVLTYGSGRMPIHHFDLYRLDAPAQLEDIALREYLESGGVCFIEWAEKFPDAFDDHLAIDIEKVSDTDRVIRARRIASPLPTHRPERGASSSPAHRPERSASPLPTRRPERSASPSPTRRPERSASSSPAHRPERSASSSPAHRPERSASPSPTCHPERSAKRGVEGSHRASVPQLPNHPLVLAFDTSNEVVAVGLGALVADGRRVETVVCREVAAHRASNTTLVPMIDELLAELGASRAQVACVCVGRGPGSFTGVRIAMACAKGIASALGVGLVGVSTLDAIAWNAQASGVRGSLLVIADAMRKEVYPALFELADDSVRRLTADRVVKAADHAEQAHASAPASASRRDGAASARAAMPSADGFPSGSAASACGDTPSADGFPPGSAASACGDTPSVDGFPRRGGARAARGTKVANQSCGPDSIPLMLAGDALVKYRDLYEGAGEVLSDKLWETTGRGLLLALQAAWRAGEADPLDAARHDPAFALPVYTRLSDAEENERAKLAKNNEKDLVSGVQGRETMHSRAHLTAPADELGVSYHPLDASHVADVAALEGVAMGTDAWNERLVAGELGRRDRSWWVAEADGALVGYAGGLVAGGELEILKVAVDPAWRRRGIAAALLGRVAEDARNLGASTCSLEVRAGNAGAQALYAALGFEPVGTRPRYYSDREDALIMRGPLPTAPHDVAGMELQHLDSMCHQGSGPRRHIAGKCATRGQAPGGTSPLILAIESSCDETAAAVVDGEGELRSDVVASQVDFHARFGGVVPEIASRKHIEAICGVCEEALDVAGATWGDLDSVAVTYAPGLLGALVVGVAFAKGAAWALDVPFIGVNHLEGHLYANKVGSPGFKPPAVVSLVSGGNTMLVHMRGWGDYRVLGATIDDAVGEAFDKVAKALGLGYPGGPVISRAAAQGDPAAIAFPRAMLHSHDLRFSLSGLKTAVVNYINGERSAGRELNIPDIAASFQQAVVDVQVAKARTALEQTGAPVFCLGGGVAANPALREAYEEMCANMGVELVMPPLASCGDNAGMIALVALDRYRANRFFPLAADARAHADLSEPY